MLELRDVRHRYDGRLVLELARFAVGPGALIAIVGPNGAGKSTLLRLLALLERPTEGAVLLDGAIALGAVESGGGTGRAAPELRRRVTLVEQRPVLFRGTVRENLEYGLRARGMAAAAAGRVIADVAARLGVTPLLARRRHQLSDGEVQRVAVARALAVAPDVLLLDEPASSADRAATQTLYHALAEERARRPLAICLASHQLEDAYRWTDDVRALADGRLSPVTPENLFRVELPMSSGEALKHVSVGPVAIAVVTAKSGPAILAIPPTDILVSREPIAASARNMFCGRVTRLARQRAGAVHVTADVGVELVAVVTDEAARELELTPGGPVAFTFKASAVRVF
jgi:tungstate transport system ATP-binding protein